MNTVTEKLEFFVRDLGGIFVYMNAMLESMCSKGPVPFDALIATFIEEIRKDAECEYICQCKTVKEHEALTKEALKLKVDPHIPSKDELGQFLEQLINVEKKSRFVIISEKEGKRFFEMNEKWGRGF